MIWNPGIGSQKLLGADLLQSKRKSAGKSERAREFFYLNSGPTKRTEDFFLVNNSSAKGGDICHLQPATDPDSRGRGNKLLYEHYYFYYHPSKYVILDKNDYSKRHSFYASKKLNLRLLYATGL